MAGGIAQLLATVALLVAAWAVLQWMMPRPLIDEFTDAYGDLPASPRAEPEVQSLRDRGAL